MNLPKQPPVPDIHVEEAWADMSKLLDKTVVPDQLPKSGKLAFSKPILASFFGLSILIAFFIWRQSTYKEEAGISKGVVYESKAIPIAKKFENGIFIFLDTATIVKQNIAKTDTELTLITGGVFLNSAASQGKVSLKAGELTIKTSGAQYFISRDTMHKVTQLNVKEGDIFISANDGTILNLQAGESVTYNSAKAFNTKDKADINLFGYATKVFEFSGTPLPEVASLVGKAYGYKIALSNNTLLHCKLTTRFDDKSIEEVMDLLSYTLNVKYTLDEKKKSIIISGNGCD